MSAQIASYACAVSVDRRRANLVHIIEEPARTALCGESPVLSIPIDDIPPQVLNASEDWHACGPCVGRYGPRQWRDWMGVAAPSVAG